MYPDSMSAGNEEPQQADGLIDRIRLIEDSPLESRADAYATVHDELRRVLEGGDRPVL